MSMESLLKAMVHLRHISCYRVDNCGSKFPNIVCFMWSTIPLGNNFKRESYMKIITLMKGGLRAQNIEKNWVLAHVRTCKAQS